MILLTLFTLLSLSQALLFVSCSSDDATTPAVTSDDDSGTGDSTLGAGDGSSNISDIAILPSAATSPVISASEDLREATYNKDS